MLAYKVFEGHSCTGAIVASEAEKDGSYLYKTKTNKLTLIIYADITDRGDVRLQIGEYGSREFNGFLLTQLAPAIYNLKYL